MNTVGYSQRTLHCLLAAGWTPDRRIDVHRFALALAAHGLYFNEPCAKVSGRGRGLSMRYPHFRVPMCQDGCHFILERVIGNASRYLVAEYESALGSGLTIIGGAFHEHMTLVMNERGAVFARAEKGTSLINGCDKRCQYSMTVYDARPSGTPRFQVLRSAPSPTTATTTAARSSTRRADRHVQHVLQ